MYCDRLVLFTPLLSIAFAGCSRQPSPLNAPASAPGARISIVKPEMRSMQRSVEQPGTVHAFEETSSYAKITGYVGSLADDPDKKDRAHYDRWIDRGSRVKKDQVLAELLVPELDQELKQKEAQLEEALAAIQQVEKSLAAAETTIEMAKAAVKEALAGVVKVKADVDRWRTELAQADDLLMQKVIDAQSRAVILKQFQAAEAARLETEARVESSFASVRKASADRDRTAADIDAARARKKVAEANIGEVNARRSYMKIRAPFDGIVTMRAVNTGDLVSAMGKKPLFIVARTNPVRIVVQVPEADAGMIAVGQEVRIALLAIEGPPVMAKVARTSWSVEPDSRTLWTEIDLPNEKGLIRPGMYVNAKISAELPTAWALPASAIGKIGDEAVIYLAEEGKAMRFQIQLGRGDGHYTQIRRIKKSNAIDWFEFTGSESVATPAAAITNGQSVP